MSEKRMNYPYAQIDPNTNIVQSVGLFWDIITPDHPGYNVLIPLREYDESLLSQRYIGRDDDGYGLFEVVEPEQSEDEQTERSEDEQTEHSEAVSE